VLAHGAFEITNPIEYTTPRRHGEDKAQKPINCQPIKIETITSSEGILTDWLIRRGATKLTDQLKHAQADISTTCWATAATKQPGAE